MAVEVYSEPLRRRYYASRFSSAYGFTLLVRGTLLTLPFFLAYTNTPSFWLKTNTYREQPKVEYEYKLLGVVQGLDATNKPFQVYYSSMSTVAYLFQSELRLPTIRSIHVDKNRDGLADRFQLEALLPLRAGEKVLSSSIVAFFDVKLRRRARLEMEALAYAQHSSPLPGRALYLDGDYDLRQRWPLRAKGGYQLPYENTPLLDDRDLNVDKATLPKLLASYVSFLSFFLTSSSLSTGTARATSRWTSGPTTASGRRTSAPTTPPTSST